MNHFIYYPGLEVRDDLWLKFALLYLDKLSFTSRTTEPLSLSQRVESLTQNTDLLGELPEPEQFNRYSQPLIQQLSSLLSPQFRRHKVFGNPELIARWQQADNHDYLWPSQPGLEPLQQFCIEKGFASIHPEGILLPKRLANLLSMRLAHEWSLESGHCLITDHDYLDRLLHLSESSYHNRTGFDSFHMDIHLKLPRDLAQIDFDDLLALRSHHGYRQGIRQLHQTLSELLKSLRRGYAHPEQLTAFYRSVDQLELFFGPETCEFTLTTILSTPLAAAPMIHILEQHQQQTRADDPRLRFHAIKKTHFNNRKRCQHFFTRLGPLRQQG
ncbi:hypothetical protein [Dongshaea marina]|uniref:hypothetical protein n=1 Tax=Dongshaea marina TaxID=2047966 RepID=UPI000D3EB51E|nr:hypothetical protein [Dongshaea marina]